jgi:hypothetical protein
MGVKLGLILREEHPLRIYENRMLMGIFGPTREKVTGRWRKLHNKNLTPCAQHRILLGWSNERR